MNKPQIQTKNGNELITKENTNNKIRKSKFNKFFSTVTAVMIASSIALGPMTLRGEETEKKTPTVQDVREKLDGMKETVKKTLETIEEKKAEEKKKIEEADKKIKESNKRVEESNKKVEESNKKVEESNKRVKEADKKYCAELETNIPLMKDYCSKNECGEEEIKILKRSLKDYKEICEKLVIRKE